MPHESGHAANSMLCPSAVYECTDAASEQSKSAQSAHTYSPDSSVNRLSSAHESSLEEAATHVPQERGHAATSACWSASP
eukprot:SAG11_NODE_60_length_19094_cov_26.549566_4_plen_80_part_00